MHGIELPFVFDHVDDMSFMIGAGADRQTLADQMSAAWVAFARTGNPSPFPHTPLARLRPCDPADDAVRHRYARRQRPVR